MFIRISDFRKICRPRRWLLPAVLLSCSACISLGPDFEAPQVELAHSWINQNDAGIRKNTAISWWRLFHDPALERLIKKAFVGNLDRQAAAVRIYEARAQLGIAKGYLFPQYQQFNMSLYAEKLSEALPYYQDLNDFSFLSFQSGFDALWEIDLWGRYRRGIESSAAQLAANILDHDDVLISLTAEVAATYIEIRTFQQRLQIAGDNEKLQAQSLAIAGSLYRNGLNTELDMQQARALLSSTRAGIRTLELGLAQSRHALSLLLGRQPGEPLPEVDEAAPIPAAAPMILAGIPADIVRRRPDIRREQQKAAAQCALIGVALSDLLPRFSLYGAIGIGSGTANGTDIFDVFNMQTLATKIGPTVSWPILQYGRLTNNIRVQDARYEELLIGYRNTVLKALQEVEDAMSGFLASLRQVEHLTESVNASKRAAELSLTQYREGIDDYTRVLNSQMFLVQQQDKLIANQGEVARHLVAAYKALGGGWELHQGQDPLPEHIKTRMQDITDWESIITDSLHLDDAR